MRAKKERSCYSGDKYPLHGYGTERRCRLAANSLYGIIARIFDFILRLVVLAWIARYLGSSSYGDFAIITAVAAFIHVLADFGMEPIVQREINIHPLEKKEFLATTLMLRSVLSAGLLAALIGVGPILGIQSSLRDALLIESTAQVFVAFQVLLLGVIRAHEQTQYDLLTTLFYQVATLSLVAITIVLDLGFTWIFIARCLVELIKLGLMGTLVHHRFIPLHFEWNTSRSIYLLKEGLPILAVSLITVTTLRVNIFILNFFFESREVAFFEFPQRLIMAVSMLPLMVVFACFPALCVATAESKDIFTEICADVFKVLLILALPLSAAFVAGGDWIVNLTAGADFTPAGTTLRILSAAIPAIFLLPLLHFALTAAGKQQMSVAGAGAGLVTNFGLAIILVPTWGFVGAAAASTCGNIANLIVTWVLVTRLAARLPPWKLAGRPLLAAAPMFVTCLLMRPFGLTGLLIGLVVSVALYGLSLKLLGILTPYDIQVIAALAGRGKRKHEPGSGTIP